MPDTLDAQCVNTLRFLSVDMVEKANSGHPGLPLGAAAFAYTLWTRHLKHNPAHPLWPDRDRFVLSAGHGSALLYSLLHLTGYALSIDDIQAFRQWGSKTPGHPERGHVPGVEVTTGPLGQGVANAVGTAIAEAHLAARYNRAGHAVVDHRTWVLASDGDLMEGVASEAASLAGHLRLAKLCCLYDDNAVTLSAATDMTFSEDRAARFAAYGWQTIRVADGNDIGAVDAAILQAICETARPTLILLRTHLGYASPAQDTFKAHGSPLGADSTKATKERLGWPVEPAFLVPAAALARYRQALGSGEVAEAAWNGRMAAYERAFPALASELRGRLRDELPAGWDADIPVFPADAKGMATRVAGGKVINAIAARLPALCGGSADLDPSTNTALKDLGDFGPAVAVASGEPDDNTTKASGAGAASDTGIARIAGSAQAAASFAAAAAAGAAGHDRSAADAPGPAGRNIHFGVREHAMGGIVNGLAAHGGFVGYGSTFLIFSDYMRPSIRLAALMGLHVVHVFTHDSLALGEDGPTHQPVEQLASLRAIPGIVVLRPADANETAVAWRMAVESRDRPVLLVLTRQDVPTLDRSRHASADGLRRGAYVLSDTVGSSRIGRTGDDTTAGTDTAGAGAGTATRPSLILIASGSEVGLIVAAAETLRAGGIAVRCVSMPSWELFDAEPQAYRDAVLPPAVTARLAVELGVAQGWHRYTGDHGAVLCVDRFGASAPAKVLLQQFGFTVDHVVERARALIAA